MVPAQHFFTLPPLSVQDQSLFGSADRTKRTNSSKSDGHAGLDKPSAIGDFFSGVRSDGSILLPL